MRPLRHLELIYTVISKNFFLAVASLALFGYFVNQNQNLLLCIHPPHMQYLTIF
jgi:hypothetical protein